MKLPIYDITIDLENDELNMSCISLVTDPAVERDFECFSKDKKPMKFTITDHFKHCITGVAIRADVPIYRYSEQMGEYYVRFNKETIEQIVYKYSKQNLWNSVSLEHSGQNIDSAVMVEFYIKSDTKCPAGFEDVEDGSLMVTYKITDDELWDTIKNSDEINGFSIEIMADLTPTNEYVEEERDFLSELLDWLGEKKNFSIPRGTVRKAIDDKKSLLIDEGGREAVEWWPHSLGKRGDDNIVILYNPKTNKWKTETLDSIDGVVGGTIGDFDYSDPTYEKIMDDDDVTVSRSVVVSGDRFLDAIKNKTWVQISYDDSKEKPALGFRQCIVVAYGTTSAGNIAIRCYEQFGDTRTICPDYKIFLLKRIKSFKEMVGVAPWTDDILDGRYHSGADKNLSYPLIYAHTLGE